MQAHPAIVRLPAFLAVYRQPVRAGFPSPADDYLDSPIDLSRALIKNAPATFIMTVAGGSAIDAGILGSNLVTVDRSLSPRDGDPVVVDVNGERSVKIFRLVGGRSCLAFGNRRYPDFDPAPDADIQSFGVVANSARWLPGGYRVSLTKVPDAISVSCPMASGL